MSSAARRYTHNPTAAGVLSVNLITSITVLRSAPFCRMLSD